MYQGEIMINNIRIKNQPLFKEFTFQEQEEKPFVLKFSVPYNHSNPYVDNILHSEVELTSFEYKILGKVFDYEPNSNIFTREAFTASVFSLLIPISSSSAWICASVAVLACLADCTWRP